MDYPWLKKGNMMCCLNCLNPNEALSCEFTEDVDAVGQVRKMQIKN